MNEKNTEKIMKKSKLPIEDIEKISGGAQYCGALLDDGIMVFAMNMHRRLDDFLKKNRGMEKSHYSQLKGLCDEFRGLALNRLNGKDVTQELESVCAHHQKLFTELDEISNF